MKSSFKKYIPWSLGGNKFINQQRQQAGSSMGLLPTSKSFPVKRSASTSSQQQQQSEPAGKKKKIVIRPRPTETQPETEGSESSESKKPEREPSVDLASASDF
jgi:hypothetical protein